MLLSQNVEVFLFTIFDLRIYNTHPAPVNTAFGGLWGGRNAPDPRITAPAAPGTVPLTCPMLVCDQTQDRQKQ